MKICAFSDTHGKYNFKIEPCDIVVICGDILPITIQKNDDKSEEWIKKFFIPWCEELPCEKVIFIGGNHDFVLQNRPEKIHKIIEESDKVIFLQDEEYNYVKETDGDYREVRIYGTPWCHQFYNWAFMTDDINLAKIYNKIPYKVDILLTHDCPYGTSDVLLQDVPWRNGEHIGCHPLGNAVDEKKPTLHFCGHLHSCLHEPQQRGDTTVTNVSMVDEHYDLVYNPYYTEI